MPVEGSYTSDDRQLRRVARIMWLLSVAGMGLGILLERSGRGVAASFVLMGAVAIGLLSLVPRMLLGPTSRMSAVPVLVTVGITLVAAVIVTRANKGGRDPKVQAALETAATNCARLATAEVPKRKSVLMSNAELGPLRRATAACLVDQQRKTPLLRGVRCPGGERVYYSRCAVTNSRDQELAWLFIDRYIRAAIRPR